MGLYTLNIIGFTEKQQCESQFNGFAVRTTFYQRMSNLDGL